MPYKDKAAHRLFHKENQRRVRARKRIQREAKRREDLVPLPPVPAKAKDQVAKLAQWSESTLVVPGGHEHAGRPMVLPKYALDFLRDGLTHHESLLCMARKNAKSAICAVLALGCLVGPLATHGWRGAVASLSKEKANELRTQAEAIATASKLEGLKFMRSPQPGYVVSKSGQLDILAADRNAGHASGFDLVIVDELGLFPERARELLAGLRSSISGVS